MNLKLSLTFIASFFFLLYNEDNSMSVSIILVALSILSVSGLAWLVFSKGRRTKIEIIFVAFCIAILFWLVGTLMMFISRNDQEAIFWDRFVYLGVVFIPILMHHFSLVFTKTKGQKKLLIIGYVLAVFFLIISRTDYFVKDLFQYQWGVHTKAQLFHHIFLVTFFADLSLLFINVYRYYKNTASPLERTRAKYVFFAFLALIGIGEFAYLPAYGISIPPFSFLAGVFFAAILAYAILRYRLLDIRLVIKRSTIYLTSFILSVGAGTALAFTLHQYSTISPAVIGILTISLSLLVFNPLRELNRRIANKLMFREVYTYQEALKKLSSKVTSVIKLQKLLAMVIDVLSKTMQIERVGILLKEAGNENYRVARMVGFKKKNGLYLVKDGFFTDFLEKNKKSLVSEELRLMIQDSQNPREKKKLEKLKKNMEKIQAALVLPLLAHNELTGLMVLGPKEDKNPYSKEDIELLESLVAQVSLALENARLYNHMQELVDQKTGEIKEKVEEIHRANMKLKKINKMRTEFLSIASHQLRTPLSAAWSIMASFADGTLEKEPPAERRRFYKMAYDSLNKLNNIVNDLLDGMEAERNKLTIRKRMISIRKVLQDALEKGEEEAKKKGIVIITKIDKDVPQNVYLDKRYIRMVFINLLDNAIKYTPQNNPDSKKKIWIKMSLESKKIKQEGGEKIKKKFLCFEIKDKGIGVPRKDQKKLFQQFSRASNARFYHTDGTGLGLYIVKKIIKEHGGKIKLTSGGENKGTKIKIELPV